jgi:hypothetical protein
MSALVLPEKAVAFDTSSLRRALRNAPVIAGLAGDRRSQYGLGEQAAA